MLSRQELINCIEKLQELPNGGGSEIEFYYRGTGYCITSFRDSCDIGKCLGPILDEGKWTYPENPIFTYRSLDELGKAKDIGFSVEEEWKSFEDICIKPDFECFSFNEIYDAYAAAYKKNNKE